jgi:hypothetical protein
MLYGCGERDMIEEVGKIGEGWNFLEQIAV